MSKKKNQHQKNKAQNHAAKQATKKQKASTMFQFGDPEPVLQQSLTSYTGISYEKEKDYYEPPVDLKGLGQLLSANSHHGRACNFKRDSLVKYFKPNDILSIKEFYKWATDFVVFGGAYFQVVQNRFGKTLYLEHVPTIKVRRMKKKNRFCVLEKDDVVKPFRANEIIYIKNYDVNQSIYGIPDYLGAIQSLLLNENATLFRRRYYINNAHMGYVFWMNDPNMDDDDEAELKKQIKANKGAGNFQSLFINQKSENAEAEKSIKIIPVGDISTKDEFERIKNISRNDIISAHGLQPALAGMMPENTGGFGDIMKINRVYFENDIRPRQVQILELNDYLTAKEQIEFDNPTFDDD